MRRTLVWSLSAIFTLVLLAGSAMSAPSTVSYQGRLTNSSGTPVADGSYSVSFSLWTDSVGGTMIWSETQNVPVSGGGLFSTQLGNTQPLGGELVIHGGDDLYLQLALSGQALTPRMALGTVPRAFASSSLNTSTPNVGTLHASVGDDTTKITASHQSAMGVIDSYVHLTDDRALLGLKAYDPAQSQSSSSGSEVMGGTARNYLDHDDDGDAVPDIVEEFSAGDGSAKIGVKASKRRFNLLDAFPQSFRVVAHDSDTGSSVSMALETDADVDGVAESGIWEKVDNTEGLSIVGVDVDEDGVPDVGTSSSAKLPRSVLKTFFERGDKPTQSQIVDSVDENGATSGVIRYEGSDFEGFQVSLMPDSAVVSTEVSNPSGSSSSRMRTRINELESKLQSIGLLARTSSTSSLTPDSVSEITESQAATTKARRLVFVSGTTGAGSLIEVNSVDDDGDGIPEQEISSKIVPTRSQHAINTKGTGAQNGRSASVVTETTPDSTRQTMSCDSDNDGNPEAISSRITNGKFTGGPGTVTLQIALSDAPGSNRKTSSQTSTDLDSAVTEVSAEDGTSSGLARLAVEPSGLSTVSVMSSDASMGTPIIKGTALLSSSPSGALHRLAWDADGDGTADRRISEDCDDEDAGISIQAGVVIPKFVDITTKAQVAAERADVGMIMGVGSDTTIKIGADDDEAGVTIQSGVAIPKFLDITARAQSTAHSADVGLIMGTGSDTAVHLGCDDTSSRVKIVPPTAGTYGFELVVTDASGLISMTSSTGTVSMQMDGNGRLGVGGAAHATNPIHHPPSGAHLTAGGVWTNASDENLKENFQPVDGSELLEKIDQLPISEWNYRTESDDVKHIGPTAQDFQATFGVGSDGKSISTIDPSGIALAAIKELNKQNQLLQKQSSELREQNEQLRKELNDLKALIEKVVSRK